MMSTHLSKSFLIITCVLLLCIVSFYYSYNILFSTGDGKNDGQRNKVQQLQQLNKLERYPNGQLHPLLLNNYLSHWTLHHSRFAREMANLGDSLNVASNKATIVVGIGNGEDVIKLAKENHHVIAFEPIIDLVNNLNQMINASDIPLNVTIHNTALGSETNKKIKIEFNGLSNHNATLSTLDDLIQFDSNYQISVLSVDVQGHEYEVFKGGSNVLKHTQILWFEALQCRPYIRQALNLLDKDFVIFDFVPIAFPPSVTPESKSKQRVALLDINRPSSFHEFCDWMCGFTEKGYFWIQTDFLAVRRSIVDSVVHKLQNIIPNVCYSESTQQHYHACALRKLVIDENGLNKTTGTLNSSLMV